MKDDYQFLMRLIRDCVNGAGSKMERSLSKMDCLSWEHTRFVNTCDSSLGQSFVQPPNLSERSNYQSYRLRTDRYRTTIRSHC